MTRKTCGTHIARNVACSLNLLTTSDIHHLKNSQLTGFYLMGKLFVNGLTDFIPMFPVTSMLSGNWKH